LELCHHDAKHSAQICLIEDFRHRWYDWGEAAETP
jgi:hypothetical protein